jgi:hypothetical protein
MDLSGSQYEPVAALVYTGSIKRGEFLDQLTEYWFLKKGSAP